MLDPEPILLSVCCLGCNALPCACPAGIEVTEEVPAEERAIRAEITLLQLGEDRE